MAAFDPHPMLERYFEREIRLMSKTLVFLPTGIAVRTNGMITSGNPWTSIIGSIANQIALYSYLIAHGVPDDEVAVYTYGDDGVLGIMDTTSTRFLNATHMSIWLKSSFGLTLKPAQTIETPNLVAELLVNRRQIRYESRLPSVLIINEPTVVFLGSMFINQGVPFRPFEDMYLRLCVPEFVGDTPAWELMRIYSYYVEHYFNPRSRMYLYDLFDFTKFRLAGNIVVTVADLMYNDDLLNSQVGLKLMQVKLPSEDNIILHHISPECKQLSSSNELL